MTIVEAIKQAMMVQGKPATPQEVYSYIVAKGLYQFNAADPIHVVRSQIRRHCVGIEVATSRPTKHFEKLPGGRFYLARTGAVAGISGSVPCERRDSDGEARPPGEAGLGSNVTIVDAIQRVMRVAAKPLLASQVYERIVEARLYEFRAKEPLHVVRSQLRRHCIDLDFPSASETKYFKLEGGQRFSLLEKAAHRQSKLARLGVMQNGNPARSGEEVHRVLALAQQTRDQVFVSYSHNDESWMRRLQVHLKPLEKAGVISRWDDTRIKVGTKWREEIANAIARARVAVLLLSADFLASDFITENELPPLLKAAADDGVMILPVIVSACRFEKTEGISQYQAINSPKRPLNGLSIAKREELFVKVADAIEGALFPG